jgi:hypothetical protein
MEASRQVRLREPSASSSNGNFKPIRPFNDTTNTATHDSIRVNLKNGTIRSR